MSDQPSTEINPTQNLFAQRDWTRFAPDCSEVWVMQGDRPVLATVRDESFGGIGLVMESIDVGELELGDEVTLFYYGHPMRGSLRWIQRDPETRQIRLGIQWPAAGNVS